MTTRRSSVLLSPGDHSRGPFEQPSSLAERKQILLRVDDLSEKSAVVLSRLGRRVQALEDDVRPVHEQTKGLYMQHKNLGLAIHSLGDVCEQLQCVGRLKQQLDLESRDWEKLTAALHDVTDCVSFLRGHATFARNRPIIAAVEEVRTAAVETLREDYCRIVEGFPSSDHGGKLDQHHKDCAAELVRLREAMAVGESDVAQDLLKQLRTESSLAAIRKLQRSFQAHPDAGSAWLPYQRGKHSLGRAGTLLVDMVTFEQQLAKSVLTGSPTEWEEPYAEVVGVVVPHLLEAVAQAVSLQARVAQDPATSPAVLTRTILVLLETFSSFSPAASRLSDALRGVDGASGLARKTETVLHATGDAAAACLGAVAQCVAGHGAVRTRGNETTAGLGADETTRVVATFAVQLLDDQPSADRALGGGEEEGGGRVAEVLRGVWSALETNLQAKARLVKDGKASLVLLLNSHFALKRRLQDHATLSRLLGSTAERTCRLLDEEMRQLVQRTWLGPLQALSGLHLPSRKLQSDGLFGRTSRHAIKDALVAFNSEVDSVLHRHDLRIDEPELRTLLVTASEDFLIPVYAEFLDKFTSSRAFSKHPDKYLLYPLDRLRPLLRSSLFSGELRQ